MSSRSETSGHRIRGALTRPVGSASIRFRLTALYSIVLFGLAAIVMVTIYVGVTEGLSQESVAEIQQIPTALDTPETEALVRAELREMESYVKDSTLDDMRRFFFGALGGMFIASLGVGWLVAGMVLRPVKEITRAARQIQVTDLSQRIGLGGPQDELRELADTFDELLARLEEAFGEQRRFIQEASHELRNPLAVMRTNLEVALADPEQSAEDLQHAAEVVSRAAERMSRLVDDLLLYAREETPEMERAPVELSAVIREEVDEFLAPATARGLDLVCDAPRDVWVVGDENALRQMLANLLANAVRLAPEGSTVRVEGGQGDGTVFVAVADEGPGIDPADQPKVFQRFWRGEGREKRGEHDGDRSRSGLGLTIVRQLAEAHGGRVELESAPGSGSVFTVIIPRGDASAPEDEPPTLLQVPPVPGDARTPTVTSE